MKSDFDFTEHALKRLTLRREIEFEWVVHCLDDPDRIVKVQSNSWHYLRRTPEFGNRTLKVIVNPLTSPPRIVTLYFDRDLSREV
jgi:hypothetical protein